MIVEVHMYFVMGGGGQKKNSTDPIFSNCGGGVTRMNWGVKLLTLVVDEPFVASWSLGGREGRMGKKESLSIDLGVVRP